VNDGVERVAEMGPEVVAANGEETVNWLSPWFHDVIGPVLVFTGHESPTSSEAQRVAAALRDVGYRAETAAEPAASV
jgi:hypothetical protein